MKNYPGSLLDDCKALQDSAAALLRPRLDLGAEILKIHGQFLALHGLAPPASRLETEVAAIMDGAGEGTSHG
jgi:hypothetical protein